MEDREEEITRDPAQIPATGTGERRGELRGGIQDPLLPGAAGTETTGRGGPTAALPGILNAEIPTYVIQRIIHDVYKFNQTFPSFFLSL